VNASRLPRLVRLSGCAAVAVLGLTACGTDLNPGTAATVGDESISEGTVDDLVSAACAYTEAMREEQGSGTEPTQSVANLRTSITRQLIQSEVTQAATQELGLTVNESTVSAIASGSEFPEAVDPDQGELLQDFFEDQSRTLLGQAVVGAHLRDESITVGDESLGQEDVDASRRYLANYADELGVEVNPAYGTWEDGDLVIASGSLSEPVSDAAKAAFTGLTGQGADISGLPESQVCG
jgi:hypothetical protein